MQTDAFCFKIHIREYEMAWCAIHHLQISIIPSLWCFLAYLYLWLNLFIRWAYSRHLKDYVKHSIMDGPNYNVSVVNNAQWRFVFLCHKSIVLICSLQFTTSVYVFTLRGAITTTHAKAAAYQVHLITSSRIYESNKWVYYVYAVGLLSGKNTLLIWSKCSLVLSKRWKIEVTC